MDKAVSIYDLIGDEGFQRLIQTFYRQVPDDPILGPMYPPEDLAGAEQRLRDFLIFRFGGPPRLHRAARTPAPEDAALPLCHRSASTQPMGPSWTMPWKKQPCPSP